MTPPPANGATIRRPIAPHVPRRVSGPAPARRGDHRPPPRATTPSRIRRRRWLIALPRLAGQFAVALPESRALDRLIRGRGWIALIATALVGIVYLQVSLLGMNQQITRDVSAAQGLEAQNTVLQSQIAQAAAGGRIQDVAARAGMVMPPAMWSSYDAAHPGDAARAAASITAPDPAAVQRQVAANAALVPPTPTVSPDIGGSTATPASIAPTAGTAAAATAQAQAAASDSTTASATAATATAVPSSTAPAVSSTTATPASTAPPVTAAPVTATPTATPPPVPAVQNPAPVVSNPAPTAAVSTPTDSTTGGVSASAGGP
jgi:hypothetical protein